MTPRRRARAAVATRAATPWPLIVLAACALTLAALASAHAQGGVATDAVPPATSQAAPAEVQPGHPPPAQTGATGSASPANTSSSTGSVGSGVAVTPPAGGALAQPEKGPR